MAKIPHIGDVVEIPTSSGRGYAMYTHRVPRYGELLRVFGTLHERRPTDWAPIVAAEPAFSSFYPLRRAVRDHVVTIAASVVVPDHLSQFPIFKAVGGIDPRTNKATSWFLWDGEKEWRTGDVLTGAERRLPDLVTSSPAMLVWKLEHGYRNESNPNIEGSQSVWPNGRIDVISRLE